MYTSADENFLFSDIQLGKGKPRSARKVTFEVDAVQEELWYRIAPCGGIKSCSNEECTFTASTREHLCPKHPFVPLKAIGRDCPMEFVYVWPDDNSDKRRWLTGICRNGDLKPNNLHNHPLHVATKISSKIIQDIKQKMTEDPTTKTYDIVTGMAQFYGISHTNINYLSLTMCMHTHYYYYYTSFRKRDGLHASCSITGSITGSSKQG